MKDIQWKRGNRPYDGLYDPMTDQTLAGGSDYCPTYWIGTAGPAPADDGPVKGDFDVECAVIGSGYTGLNAAIANCLSAALTLQSIRFAPIFRRAMPVTSRGHLRL